MVAVLACIRAGLMPAAASADDIAVCLCGGGVHGSRQKWVICDAASMVPRKDDAK